ncbi:hypothetical protein NDU88_007128 [Pleurodeles waltl]|uniref:Uncharacterized protein n=1 Tax=Pleurodeles waltl TaxID=8319 RepID=A0AAV7RS30_PLEWA|nr:hypothetical protein NDU88_007128 [Pleurodeles waltl]
MTRPEPKPGGRGSPEEEPSKPGAQPEEGDWEERRSEQTCHALGRAWPSQVQHFPGSLLLNVDYLSRYPPRQKYHVGTLKSVHTDPEVLGAAPTALQRKDAEAGRVFKPLREEQGKKRFLPEEKLLPERRTRQPDRNRSLEDNEVQKRRRASPERIRRKATGRREGANRPATLWEEHGPVRPLGVVKIRENWGDVEVVKENEEKESTEL